MGSVNLGSSYRGPDHMVDQLVPPILKGVSKNYM